MTLKGNFVIDDYGLVHYDEIYGMEFLYEDFSLELFSFQKDVSTRFNDIQSVMSNNRQITVETKHPETTSIQNFHDNRKGHWLIPQEYKNIDLYDYFSRILIEKDDIEVERVRYELSLFDYYNMNNLLRTAIYIVDVLNNNKVVYGIGRGSSVSCYCLYLLGLHKVDSLYYNLDVNEFFD